MFCRGIEQNHTPICSSLDAVTWIVLLVMRTLHPRYRCVTSFARP
jgi:hypothetical protein